MGGLLWIVFAGGRLGHLSAVRINHAYRFRTPSVGCSLDVFPTTTPTPVGSCLHNPPLLFFLFGQGFFARAPTPVWFGRAHFLPLMPGCLPWASLMFGAPAKGSGRPNFGDPRQLFVVVTGGYWSDQNPTAGGGVLFFSLR